jgi:hypothetical protein
LIERAADALQDDDAASLEGARDAVGDAYRRAGGSLFVASACPNGAGDVASLLP